MKIKTITLSFPHLSRDPNLDLSDKSADRWVYFVEKVTDSTVPAPMTYMKKAEVDALCADEAWKVTVTKSVSG